MSRAGRETIFAGEKTSDGIRLAHWPMENPMLFAEFSDVNPEEESLFAWADEHKHG
jgi:hypothetical protein